MIISEPQLTDIADGEEVSVSVAEYLALWGCDLCYDRAPRNPGDGYIFYNYGPEEDSVPYLKDKLLPALARQLQDTTLSDHDRSMFQRILAHVNERLRKEFGLMELPQIIIVPEHYEQEDEGQRQWLKSLLRP